MIEGGARRSERPENGKPCAHFPDCVGCALIGTPYGRQLQRKREAVRAAFSSHAALAHLAVPEPIGSPKAFGYRNQAKLVARRTQRGLLLGMYRPGTHKVVDIGRCPVHDPLIARVLEALRRLLEGQQVPTYDERSGHGWLRYVVVRSSGWQRSAQVILVVRDRSFAGERQLVRGIMRVRGVTSVVLGLNPHPGNAIFGERFVAAAGKDALIERVGPLRLKTRAGAFLQANVGVARRLYEHVLRWADPHPGETCVDLYCGVGAISFNLATRAERVFGIEESPIAVLDAKENIRLNGFHNVRFLAGPAAVQLSDLAPRLERVDLITLNPPRKGADEPTRLAITACGAPRIVYVSCDPSTLARDLSWFAAHGYETEAVQPFDLLPQTDHVECVALLRRGGVGL
jgi:23S rRNA (uracil1939-C5)-methyltransferase